jgi:hypothetical protein
MPHHLKQIAFFNFFKMWINLFLRSGVASTSTVEVTPNSVVWMALMTSTLEQFETD